MAAIGPRSVSATRIGGAIVGAPSASWTRAFAGAAFITFALGTASALPPVDERSGLWIFEQSWPSASFPRSGGMSCADCHASGARGVSPVHGGTGPSMVYMLYRPSGERRVLPLRPDRIRGGFDSFPIIRTSYLAQTFFYPDGSNVVLHRPVYGVRRTPGPAPIISPRVAPDISSISPCVALGGRCGYRLEAPSVEAQIAAAFTREMGVPMLRRDRPAFDRISPRDIALLAAYLRDLTPPETGEPAGSQALQIAQRIGCIECHPVRPTRDRGLHDMGPDLADLNGETILRHRQWSSSSLAEIRSARNRNPAAGYLHDGRALSVAEAILWHAGDARLSRDAFVALPKRDRDMLLFFLDSQAPRR